MLVWSEDYSAGLTVWKRVGGTDGHCGDVERANGSTRVFPRRWYAHVEDSCCRIEGWLFKLGHVGEHDFAEYGPGCGRHDGDEWHGLIWIGDYDDAFCRIIGELVCTLFAAGVDACNNGVIGEGDYFDSAVTIAGPELVTVWEDDETVRSRAWPAKSPVDIAAYKAGDQARLRVADERYHMHLVYCS